MEYLIRDISLAEEGAGKISWVRSRMPVLAGLEAEFEKEKPFKGLKITVSVHLEAKTAYLAKVLHAGGARVRVTGSNPLSTQDAITAALVKDGLEVFAWHGATPEEYRMHIMKALEFGPDIIIDDGGDLVNLLHTELAELSGNVLGGCEETTTGVLRLRALEKEGMLRFPMFAVNDADCKHLFDNRYGTGQSAWDGIMRTTNLSIAGKTAVVAGYGWCGKGVAARAAGLGANVIVTEVNPIRAVEAAMDGFRVMPMDEAAPLGDFFVTVTGCRDVIGERHFPRLKNGAILSNAGHFNVEIAMERLEQEAVLKFEQRKNIMGYEMPDGRIINVLGEGRLVNLACADGHPAEIMDMSFALQALCARFIAQEAEYLEKAVLPVPAQIDNFVAQKALQSMGITIDELTAGQEEYLRSWQA
ncbi:MAG: adenosylhomocysteinase [Clostridia bacterium]|nr:adenosylhomocysteinase [Clostridia bacterium]